MEVAAQQPGLLLTQMVSLISHRKHRSSLPNNSQLIHSLFPIDCMHVMCTKPPRYVLFRPLRPRASSFEAVEDGIVPIFPIERSITIKNNSIRRKQVPMCAAFRVPDYKAQGQAFLEGVVDLKHDSKAKGRDGHRIFCSINVQLSRFTSLQRLY